MHLGHVEHIIVCSKNQNTGSEKENYESNLATIQSIAKQALLV